MPFSGALNTASIEASRWLIENAPVKIQIHGHWVWRAVRGSFLTNARVPALVPGVEVGACSPATDHSDAASQVRFGFVEYATRFQVCNADQDRYGSPNEAEQLETVLAQIKLDYAYYAQLDKVTGNPDFGGLPDICAPGNFVNMAGAALDFPCLEQAFSLVTANNGRPTMIMSNTRAQMDYHNLCWNAGIEPPKMPWRWYDPFKGWQTGLVTAFHGVPWLINDMIPEERDVLEQRRIYFMVVGDDGGPGPTRGVIGIRPAHLMGSPYVKRITQGVPNFATQQVNMTRDAWLTMPAGLALGSQGALSILTNFNYVGLCQA